jgi:hypothetical protein
MVLEKFRDSLVDLDINQNLSELVESEKKYLINLFAIKEKFDERLDLLGST